MLSLQIIVSLTQSTQSSKSKPGQEGQVRQQGKVRKSLLYFWQKLHYKLPHKNMEEIEEMLPRQTEIELDNEPFINQNSV